MNSIKELYKGIESVKYEITNTYDDEKKADLGVQLEALNRLYTHLHSYYWLSHKRYIEQVKLYINTNFNIKKCVDLLGVSEGAFESSMSYASKKFTASIGKGTLNMIMSGYVSSGVLKFELSTGNLTIDSFIFSDLLPRIPKGDITKSLNIRDCKDELSFLYEVSKIRLIDKLNRLDKDKLSYLIAILQNSNVADTLTIESLIKYMLGSTDDQSIFDSL